MRKTVFIGIIAAAFIAGSPSSPAQAADEHNENAGIFTAQIQEDGSDIAWGQAVLVVDKPIEEVLPIIRDYANYVQFMPNFTKSRVLAQRGQLNLAERPQEGDSRVVEAHLMEGNVDAFSARWRRSRHSASLVDLQSRERAGGR
jgi:hypothetical protein